MRWHDVLFNEHTTEMLRLGVDIIKTTGTLERYKCFVLIHPRYMFSQ